MPIILEDVQYSEEWWKSRCGCPSASRFNEIVTTTGELSKSREKYLYQLIVERHTGKCADNKYASSSMKRGHQLEPEARDLFSFVQDVEVREVGFCFSDEQRRFGASPDGLFLDTGLEIYCPEASSAGYCLLHPDEAITTAKKYQQIMGTMLVMGFDHYYFMSYYPGLNPLIIKVERNDKFIAKLETELESFCYSLAKCVQKLKEI